MELEAEESFASNHKTELGVREVEESVTKTPAREDIKDLTELETATRKK